MTTETMLQDTLDKGFKLFKKQYVALILGTLLAAAGSIFIITIPPLFFGVYYMAIQAMKGKKIKITDVFKGFNYFVVSWVMFIVGFAAIIVGLICFILPGLLLMVAFQYAAPIAILEDKGAIESLKKSMRITQDNAGFSVILWLFVAIIDGIGGALRVGWLVSHPYTVLCTCIAADKLGKKK